MLSIDTLRKVAAADPDDATIRFVLGQKLYEEDGSAPALAESELHLRAALQAQPGYLVAYYVLGQVLAEQQKTGEAIEVLNEGIRRAVATGTTEGHDLKPNMENLLESLR